MFPSSFHCWFLRLKYQLNSFHYFLYQVGRIELSLSNLQVSSLFEFLVCMTKLSLEVCLCLLVWLKSWPFSYVCLIFTSTIKNYIGNIISCCSEKSVLAAIDRSNRSSNLLKITFTGCIGLQYISITNFSWCCSIAGVTQLWLLKRWLITTEIMTLMVFVCLFLSSVKYVSLTAFTICWHNACSTLLHSLKYLTYSWCCVYSVCTMCGSW